MMKQPEEPKRIKNDPYGCDIPHALDIKACSARDCTGLIPSLPQSEAELESYEDIYPYSGGIAND